MKQIRNNVFETNSSSSHSISIRKQGEYITPEEVGKDLNNRYVLDKKGKLSFYNIEFELEFGRTPFEALTTFYDKLRFAIASLAKDKTRRKEIESVMFEMIPGLTCIEYPEAEDWKTHKKVPYYGDIDHQSLGLLESFLDKHNITIKEFLTNNKYVVFIDGDEYNVTEHLFESKLLHKEDFEEISTSLELPQNIVYK